MTVCSGGVVLCGRRVAAEAAAKDLRQVFRQANPQVLERVKEIAEEVGGDKVRRGFGIAQGNVSSSDGGSTPTANATSASKGEPDDFAYSGGGTNGIAEHAGANQQSDKVSLENRLEQSPST